MKYFLCEDKHLMRKNFISLLILNMVFFNTVPVYSGEVSISSENTQGTDAIQEIRNEIRWLQAEALVSISTRHETPTNKAPSIITVITAEEIRNSGYRTLVEILRMIPGFALLNNPDRGGVFPSVRGLDGSNKVRMMLNGHLVNDPLRGQPFHFFDDFPVEKIKRLEIIRGPGSAMYGENAFLAVINIITKNANDIDGIRVSGGYGRFDTYEGNILFGKRLKDFDVSGMYRYRETNGFHGVIDRDNQTNIDELLAPIGFPAVSQAPGKIRDWRRQYDVNLRMEYKDFYIEGLYLNKNHGIFTSPQLAVTDESDWARNYVFVEGGYKITFMDRLTLKPRVYFDQFDLNLDTESLPEGTILPVDTDGDGIPNKFNVFPDGLKGIGDAGEQIVGAEIPVDYELFAGNTITLGIEWRRIRQTNVSFWANFVPPTLDPLPDMVNFSDNYNWLKETTRRIWSLYVQDMWDITDTLNLTMGLRYDEYNDFDDGFSPRIGLTWSFMKNASLKLLYGRAFRAPNFIEMFATNQPAILGNEDLNPETIRTYEVGLNYKFNKYVTGNINYFYNDIRDIIDLQAFETTQDTTRFDNVFDAYIQGIEAEAKFNISEKINAFMNYTYLDAENEDGRSMPNVAKHKGNIGCNIKYPRYINTNLSAFASGKRSREAGDSRDDVSSYALLNLSVIAKEFFKTMEVQGSVFNLLDKDYNNPGPTAIPDDLPRPGRTFYIGLSFEY